VKPWRQAGEGQRGTGCRTDERQERAHDRLLLCRRRVFREVLEAFQPARGLSVGRPLSAAERSACASWSPTAASSVPSAWSTALSEIAPRW